MLVLREFDNRSNSADGIYREISCLDENIHFLYVRGEVGDRLLQIWNPLWKVWMKSKDRECYVNAFIGVVYVRLKFIMFSLCSELSESNSGEKATYPNIGDLQDVDASSIGKLHSKFVNHNGTAY